MSLEDFKNKVIELSDKFERNESKYKNQVYNEEELKTEFLNPLFKSLGWDINNEQGNAPQYKEVVFEDSIKVGGKSRAPDYSFRLGGQRIFFLEAKKPYVKIESNKETAFQTRRYGWSAGLKASVLSDFEHLAIYETQRKPKKTENASIGRLKLYHYSEYLKNAEEIYNLLSKEAVMKGLFDSYFDNNRLKKGTSTVDDEFLKEIDGWRLILARNIALRNKDLSINDLNYAVQLIIDRVIFFRMAEDRGIEKYKTLYNLLDNENIYESFCDLCIKADLKYNSGLFHFHEEKNNDDVVDTFTLNLNIDNKVFKEIFSNLYYPNNPYEFSVISSEILGHVYEQFLGKVIRLTNSHQAKVEERPEVKKAGGIFYTPQYIVDYIVENTLGKLVKGKTPNKLSKLKIIDPACGSGSFLLGAYNYLLNWHLEYYSNLEKPPKNVIFQSKNGEYKLTIQEKKRILINNIYGVDLDYLAVEVTKLSLILKVLEDVNKDVLEAQQKLIQERVLPNLGNNIKCGNSLVKPDISVELPLSIDEELEIRPFNWEDEFLDVFSQGGFDLVIGNPPYGAKYDGNTKSYIKNHYISGESAINFLEIYKDVLSSEKSMLGFIIPKAFTFASNYKKIRESLMDNITNIVDCKKVWKKVKLEQVILLLDSSKKFNYYISSVRDENKIMEVNKISKQDYFNFGLFLNDISEQELKLGKKLRKSNRFINDFSTNSRGGTFQRFVKDSGDFKALGGKEIGRFGIVGIKGKVDGKHLLNEPKCFIQDNALLVQNLVAHIKNPSDHLKITACIPDNKDYVILDTINQINFEDIYDSRAFWLLFNSKLINWYAYKFIFGKAIRTMHFDNMVTKRIPVSKNIVNNQELIELADLLIELNKKLNEVNSPHDKEIIKKQINLNINKGNYLIYELYNLTEDEIVLVENSFK